jgi:hypothetical protein
MPGTVGSVVGSIEGWAALAIGILAFGVCLWGLIDALTRRADAFAAVNRLTKVVWLIILGVATLVAAALITVGSLFLSLIALAAGLVYLLDTRPKIREITAAPRTHQGPYGPW